MAFFPIDFRHKPYSASFPFELRRVKALFCRIAILRTHHFTFEGVRLVILVQAFDDFIEKFQVKFTTWSLDVD